MYHNVYSLGRNILVRSAQIQPTVTGYKELGRNKPELGRIPGNHRARGNVCGSAPGGNILL